MKEIELFGLLANRIKKLLIPISILFVNIFKLICCCFVFLPKFLDNLSAIFYFLLEVIVLFIFFEKCFFLSFLFFKQFYLLLFLFFKLQLHLTLCLSLLSLLLFKGITTLHQLSLHLQEQIFKVCPPLSLFLKRCICLFNDLLLGCLLFKQLFCWFYIWILSKRFCRWLFYLFHRLLWLLDILNRLFLFYFYIIWDFLWLRFSTLWSNFFIYIVNTVICLLCAFLI